MSSSTDTVSISNLRADTNHRRNRVVLKNRGIKSGEQHAVRAVVLCDSGSHF